MKHILDQIPSRIKASFNLEDLIFYAHIPLHKHTVKKNNRPIYKNKTTGISFTGKSPELKAAEEHMIISLRSMANVQGIVEPYDGPVWTIMHFYFDNYYTEKGAMNKNIPDLSNLYQLPEDALQTAGIIVNDNQIESHDLSRRLPSKDCALEVFVLKYNKEWMGLHHEYSET